MKVNSYNTKYDNYNCILIYTNIFQMILVSYHESIYLCNFLRILADATDRLDNLLHLQNEHRKYVAVRIEGEALVF